MKSLSSGIFAYRHLFDDPWPWENKSVNVNVDHVHNEFTERNKVTAMYVESDRWNNNLINS